MGNLGWVRGTREAVSGWTDTSIFLPLTTISTIQTVRRIAIDVQISIELTAALATVLGRVINFGVSLDPSTSSPTWLPYTDSNAIDPNNGDSPWLWWGGTTWNNWQVYPPSDSAAFTTQSAQQIYIDTRTQRRGYQEATQLYFVTESADQAAPALPHDFALSYSILVETFS